MLEIYNNWSERMKQRNLYRIIIGALMLVSGLISARF